MSFIKCKVKTFYSRVNLKTVFFPPNQDFTVTWYRVESGSALLLAYFKNSSQETLINQPRLSWKEELINSRDFSLTVKDLHLSDSGEYLCDISSNESTLLTSQTLHVEASPRAPAGIIVPVLVAVVSAVLLLSVAPRAVRSKRCIGFHRERHPPTNQDSSSAGTTEENVALSDYLPNTGTEDRSWQHSTNICNILWPHLPFLHCDSSNGLSWPDNSTISKTCDTVKRIVTFSLQKLRLILRPPTCIKIINAWIPRIPIQLG